MLYLFATSLSGSCTSSLVKVAISAVRSKHIDLGLRCDTANMLTLKRVLEGISRVRASTPKYVRQPVTTSILAQFTSILDSHVWEDRLFFAVACVATYGLLRTSEIFQSGPLDNPGLLVSDLHVVSNSRFSLTLRKSKTDQRGQGVVVEFYANNSPSCPCRAFLLGYWSHMRGKLSLNSPLFCYSPSLPYTKHAFVTKLRVVVQRLGLNPKEFSGHSFRRGGATSLAANGVADSTIKTIGRWRSVAYQVYIDTSEDSKRQASMVMARSTCNSVKRVWGQPQH